jgi:hypothetical protein
VRQWEEEGYIDQLCVHCQHIAFCILNSPVHCAQYSQCPVWGENGCRLRGSGRRRATLTLPALQSC